MIAPASVSVPVRSTFLTKVRDVSVVCWPFDVVFSPVPVVVDLRLEE